jgi:hypothetical protein
MRKILFYFLPVLQLNIEPCYIQYFPGVPAPGVLGLKTCAKPRLAKAVSENGGRDSGYPSVCIISQCEFPNSWPNYRLSVTYWEANNGGCPNNLICKRERGRIGGGGAVIVREANIDKKSETPHRN